jgi:hypothetical protein
VTRRLPFPREAPARMGRFTVRFSCGSTGSTARRAASRSSSTPFATIATIAPYCSAMRAGFRTSCTCKINRRRASCVTTPTARATTRSTAVPPSVQQLRPLRTPAHSGRLCGTDARLHHGDAQRFSRVGHHFVDGSRLAGHRRPSAARLSAGPIHPLPSFPASAMRGPMHRNGGNRLDACATTSDCRSRHRGDMSPAVAMLVRGSSFTRRRS